MSAPTSQQLRQQMQDIIDDDRFAGWWLEYGVIEHEYAHRHRADFLALHAGRPHAFNRSGNPAETISKYLSLRVLSRLHRENRVRLQRAEPTGAWREWDASVSWWASTQGDEPQWDDQHRLTCAHHYMAYVPPLPGQNVTWRL